MDDVNSRNSIENHVLILKARVYDLSIQKMEIEKELVILNNEISELTKKISEERLSKQVTA